MTSSAMSRLGRHHGRQPDYRIRVNRRRAARWRLARSRLLSSMRERHRSEGRALHHMGETPGSEVSS